MSSSPDVSPTRFERINLVFSGALERAPETRPAYLDESCGEDAELRREVESLLAALERSGGRWESPILGLNVAEAVDGGSVAIAASDHIARVGETVGPYRLVRLIAQGGMGAVYEGHRADDAFEKRVAIKFLRRGADTELTVQRFRHERAILASLEHRNIAALLDGGVLHSDHPYFVMEYVEGAPITQYADEHRLTVRERVLLMRQVCRAVQHAHERLIIHRDLKPGNIFVATDGTVKLLDFGIAKLLAPTPVESPVTQGHERAMTLEYASPEQLKGSAVSTATDVYSLGVVLYELLAGRRPFDVQGQPLHEVTRTICETLPARPSAAVTAEAVANRGAPSLRALQRELSGDLDAVTLMALRKDANRRYGSAERLSQDLRRYLEGRPVSAGPDAIGYRVRKFVTRHRWESAAAVLLLLSLVGGALTTASQARRAEARYRDGRRLANALIADVHDAIADLPGATAVRARLIGPALDYLDRTSRDAGHDPDLDLELVFAYQRIGDVQGNPTNANLGDIEGARESFGKGMAIAERLVATGPPAEPTIRALALVSERLADVTAPTGAVRDAVGYQRRALEMYERIVREWPTPDATHALAVSQLKLGDLLGHPAFRNLGDTAAAMAQYRAASALLEAGAATATDRYRNRRYRALLAERMGRIAQDGHDSAAVGLLESSLALRQELALERPSSVEAQRDVAITHFLICALHLQRRSLSDALASCHQSLEIRQRLYLTDPKNSQLVRGMGLIHRRLGDVEVARGNASSALDHFRVAAAFYDTLQLRGAATNSDRADAEAVKRLALTPVGRG